MLYNKAWDKTETDVFSLESLIAWLEKQPRDGEYNWNSFENCMCAQYFGGRGWALLHDEFEQKTGIRPDAIAFEKPHTFGAALERARKAVA